MILLLLLWIPAAACGLIAVSRRRGAMEWTHASASVAVLILAGVLALGHKTQEPVALGGLLRADALSV